jgi:type I restriction enzyme R subunit
MVDGRAAARRLQASRAMALGAGPNPTLNLITDTGSSSVQEKEKALLAEIIAKVNDLFEGDLTEGDKLVYVNHVLKGKLLESPTLMQQAQANTKKQFAESPNLDQEFMNAVMDSDAAFAAMTHQFQ